MVSFALEAHLDASQRRGVSPGVTGRRALVEALGIDATALSNRLAAPDRLAELVRDAENYGFAPRQSVTRLAVQVELKDAHEGFTIGPEWWPKLRALYRLGSTEEPIFRTPAEVLMAAEAFAADHPGLLKKPPNELDHSDRVARADDTACRQLLRRLCWLSTGPYGVAYDCQRLISYLAPLAPKVVTDFIGSGVVTTQVVRALDRSLRRCKWNGRMRYEYHSLLANPPTKIYRRTDWMRALRRLGMLDLHLGKQAHDGETRDWIYDQLVIALQGDQSYRGARATDRRYAFWCLAELATDAQWDSVRPIAAGDDEVTPLLPLAVELRQHLSRLEDTARDAFKFYPHQVWSEHVLQEDIDRLIGEGAVARRTWILRSVWGWARPRTRITAMALLREALFSPDVIKQRSCTDALRAAGPETRASIAETTAMLLTVIESWSAKPLFLVERALAILGMMASPVATSVIERAVRGTLDESVVQAIASAGDLAHANRNETIGLMAFTVSRVEERYRNEDIVLAGVRAVLANRESPKTRLPKAYANSKGAIRDTFEWAEQVMNDPLFS